MQLLEDILAQIYQEQEGEDIVAGIVQSVDGGSDDTASAEESTVTQSRQEQ
jgi:hypothetical protein